MYKVYDSSILPIPYLRMKENNMKTKEELSKIFIDTLEVIKVGGYENMKGNWTEIKNVRGTFYETLPALQLKFKEFETKIVVEEKDTFQKAKEMGSKCAVLNMASYQNPGGDVIWGSMSQEEELCRRSNLYYSISMFGNPEYKLSGHTDPDKTNNYPIPFFGGIYSPRVSIFRSITSYMLLDRPRLCSVISVPAVKKPELDKKTGNMTGKYEIIMCGKIRAILRIALMHGHTKLVLGAFGCGSYGCPPFNVANLFKKVLSEKEFKNHFEEICFAIVGCQDNIRSFKKVFS
jgi:uncharacterized protein (TIGR02452 family)